MATDRLPDNVIDSSDERGRRQALAASLQSAVEALSACVEAMYAVLDQVDADDRADAIPADPVSSNHHPAPVRPRVSYGGGRSTLVPIPASRLRPSSTDAASPSDLAEPSPGSALEPLVRQPQDPHPGASALMAAADMAHEGYSTDEIAERLRLRWGDRAASILRDLLD